MSIDQPNSRNNTRLLAISLAVAVIVSSLGCGPGPVDPSLFAVESVEPEPAREACAHRDPSKFALFGDLHVHTALSTDASNYDLEVRPSGALGYAFGEEILLPPKNEAGEGTLIEPSPDWDSESGYGDYLDCLHNIS